MGNFKIKRLGLMVLIMVSCGRGSSPQQVGRSPAVETTSSLSTQYIDVDFPQIHQTLLLNGLTPVEKAARWSRFFKQRGVRWTGQLVSATNSSFRFRHLASTWSFNAVVLTARSAHHPVPKPTVGRFYTYMGRLERYDDDSQVIYLDQGTIFDAGPAGVPGTLAPIPEMTRRLPGPPRVLASP